MVINSRERLVSPLIVVELSPSVSFELTELPNLPSPVLSCLSSPMELITKARFDQAIAMELEVWIHIIKQEKIDKKWIVDVQLFHQADIWYYLGTPLVADFLGLKEEAIKFIISQYHDGTLWLEK